MSKNEYGGMTVNERLFVSGLLDSFDNAISNKDIDRVIKILYEVELTKDNIDAIHKHYNLSE
ncbi:MAG: hypothetical protein RL308_1432 [Bacteroidota bacterium]|jgi:hypothetical protein